VLVVPDLCGVAKYLTVRTSPTAKKRMDGVKMQLVKSVYRSEKMFSIKYKPSHLVVCRRNCQEKGRSFARDGFTIYGALMFLYYREADG
jgi:hypothetical protein